MMTSHLPLAEASAWIRRFAPLIPEGEILDLACGSGRHARFLAKEGHPVLAVDKDPDALSGAAGACITTLQMDLEAHAADEQPQWPFEADRFAGIVVTNYLHRPLLPFLFASLAPSGLLLYETFASGNEHFGKPSNPAFLLQPGELLRFAMRFADQGARVVAYEDGYAETPKPAMVQRLCLIKGNAACGPKGLRLF
ncbi:class I SAM-dependent methyltransferase [Noviherbaspirillum aerium]|uniref:class I SAM-dependent methyltransferase n=1 Tax=Noviherbaspirillum aerium TaxID=2588497 RepID=UPI001CEF95A9|nr:class I SAM-dependent methyltransferase [Noviherbaspirillum aerium]